MAAFKETLKDNVRQYFPTGWQEIILEEYKQGASDVEIRAMISLWRGSFSINLWTRWVAEEIEFKEVIEMGKILSEAWWIKNGRTNLKVKDFNYTGWYMNMKNRFGWRDRQDISNDEERVSTGSIVTLNFRD